MKKNIFYNFLLTGSNLVFPLLTFPYLSRILGASGMGICNFILSYGQNYIVIAALGIPVYGVREIAKINEDESKRSKLFFEILTVHLLFTFLLLLIYIISVFSYSDFQNYKTLALLGGSFILLNVFSIEWLFTGLNNFKYITIRSLVVRSISVIAILLFVKKADDFFIFFVILVATTLITVIINVYYARTFISTHVKLTAKGILSHVKPVFILGVYMVLTSIYTILPTTLLGFLSTKESVGYYFSANRIIRMVLSLFTAFTTVLVPRLNMAAEKKDGEYVALVNKSLNVVITFGIPTTLFICVTAKPLMLLLAGKGFMNSIPALQIMAPVVLIVAFAQVFVFLILSVNRKDKEMVTLSVIGMIISVLINLIFIPIYAEKATAFSLVFSELFVTVAAFVLSKKLLAFGVPYKTIFLNIICPIPFIFLTYLFEKLSTNHFIVLCLSSLFCGLYFLFYQLFIIKDTFVIDTLNSFLLKYKKKVIFSK
ncbi:MAG: flippase [Ginsengibacter sp.]